MRFEDDPQTDEGGVAFVRDVFQSMGGTVVPPPDHHEDGVEHPLQDIFQSWRTTIAPDASPMDFQDAYSETGMSFFETGVQAAFAAN